MAGTLPHAVFVETGIDDAGQAVAWAGELPGCAAYGASPEAAVAGVPARVAAFVGWLRAHGDTIVEPVGNWYEVERVACRTDGGSSSRAAFSLDDLAPSADELTTWLGWAELAREELASALDAHPTDAHEIAWLADQDATLATTLGGGAAEDHPSHVGPVDRLYASRDKLVAAIDHAGVAAEGLRRAIRLAIADDLRASELLRGR